MMVGLQPWTRWLFLWTDLFLVGLSGIMMLLFWQHMIVLYLKCGARFKPVMHHCVKFLKINDCGVPTLNMLIIFVNWYISSCAICTRDLSVLTTDYYAIINLGVCLESVMHHWIQFPGKRIDSGFQPWPG